MVGALAGHALKAGEQLVVDLLGAELLDQFVVVDRLDDAVLADLARDLWECVLGLFLSLFLSRLLCSVGMTHIVGVDCLLLLVVLVAGLGDRDG